MDYTTQKIIELVDNPITGPFYGEDFCIDHQGYIQVNDPKTAGLIIRTVNQSGVFSNKIVKIGTSGDAILLGFDTLQDAEPIFETTVGPEKTLVQVKKTTEDKLCVYLGGRRSAKLYNTLSTIKKYIKKLDQELHQVNDFDTGNEE